MYLNALLCTCFYTCYRTIEVEPSVNKDGGDIVDNRIIGQIERGVGDDGEPVSG